MYCTDWHHQLLLFVACQYVFQYPTSAACFAEILECTATGPDGSQYDLSALSLPSSNWNVFAGDTLYEINVCRPVVDPSCPASAGICSVALFVKLNAIELAD